MCTQMYTGFGLFDDDFVASLWLFCSCVSLYLFAAVFKLFVVPFFNVFLIAYCFLICFYVFFYLEILTGTCTQ